MTRLAFGVTTLTIALGVGVWLGIAWEQGRQAQRETALRIAEETHRARINATETARLTAERARTAFDQHLEDAAHAQPVTTPAALSVERVRRLNAR